MPGQATLTIMDKQWSISLATTLSELTQGLGGLPGIPAGSGMLFDLGMPQTIQVTTVPMLFPLDIAFLSENLVITEVYRDILPNYLVISTLPARSFIEVNAGELDGIDTGDRATVELLPLQGPLAAQPDWMSALVSLMEFTIFGLFMVGMVRTLVKGMFAPEEKKEVIISGEKYQVMPGKYGAVKRLLPQTMAKGKFIIQTDRMGDIIITHTDEPGLGLKARPEGKSVFLQFESDKELVYDLLRKSEREELDKGWNVEIKDSEPRATTLQELWENSALLPLTQQQIHRLGKSARGVMPQLPPESKGDFIFAENIHDLVKMGEVISDEDARRMWEAWKKHSGGWPSLSALPQTKVQARKPARDDVSVGSWVERDRIGIWITDNRTDKMVAEWWDEDAAQMFEDGFFKRGRIQHQTITGREFENSVLDYAEYIGILEKSGEKANYLPQTTLRGDVIEMPFKDAPEWVQDAWKRLHPGSIPRVHVYRTNTARIDSPVFEYAVRDIVASKAGKTMTRYVPAYESLISASPEEKTLYFGGAVKLQPDEAVAVMDFWGGRFKSIDLYVHPAAYEPPKLIAPHLSSRQMKVLATIRAYTPRYRKEVFDTNSVTQGELDELQRLGLIDRRGALTVMGRNVVGREEPLSSYLPQTDQWGPPEFIPKTTGENEPIKRITLDDLKAEEGRNQLNGPFHRELDKLQERFRAYGETFVLITDPRDSRFHKGDLVNWDIVDEENERLIATGKRPANGDLWNPEWQEYLTHAKGNYVKVITPGQTSLTIGSVVTEDEAKRENKRARERDEQPATVQVWEEGKLRLLRPKLIPIGKAKQTTSDLEYLADSPEFLTQTIEDIGYRDKLDNAFKAAIARARGTHDLTERITDGGDAGK